MRPDLSSRSVDDLKEIGDLELYIDQTLVIKGVPEDKKALITQALQTYTTGQLGIPNYVKDNTNVFVLYGGPVQYICYANYADAQKCVEAVVGMENWLRGQGDWARMLLVYVKILNGPTVPSA